MNPAILSVLPPLVGVLFLGYWAVMHHAASAPVAWEDEQGFHFGPTPGHPPDDHSTNPKGA